MTVTVVATDCNQILLFEPFDVFAPTPNFTPRLSPPLKLERGKPGMFHGMKYVSYSEVALNWWASEFAIVLSWLLPLTNGASSRSSNWVCGRNCFIAWNKYLTVLNWWARLVNSLMIVLLTILSRFGVGNWSSNWVCENRINNLAYVQLGPPYLSLYIWRMIKLDDLDSLPLLAAIVMGRTEVEILVTVWPIHVWPLKQSQSISFYKFLWESMRKSLHVTA